MFIDLCTFNLSEPPHPHTLCLACPSPEPTVVGPLSTSVPPDTDSQSCLPCVSSEDLEFPFMKEHRTAAWVTWPTLHLTTEYRQRTIFEAAPALSVTEAELVKAISRYATECTALNSLQCTFIPSFYFVIQAQNRNDLSQPPKFVGRSWSWGCICYVGVPCTAFSSHIPQGLLGTCHMVHTWWIFVEFVQMLKCHWLISVFLLQ